MHKLLTTPKSYWEKSKPIVARKVENIEDNGEKIRNKIKHVWTTKAKNRPIANQELPIQKRINKLGMSCVRLRLYIFFSP